MMCAPLPASRALATVPLVVIVSSEVPALLSAPKLHTASAGKPEQVNVIELAEKLATVRVDVPAPPEATDTEVGLAVTAGNGAALTVRLAGAKSRAVNKLFPE
jgi:hypothetical protein